MILPVLLADLGDDGVLDDVAALAFGVEQIGRARPVDDVLPLIAGRKDAAAAFAGDTLDVIPVPLRLVGQKVAAVALLRTVVAVGELVVIVLRFEPLIVVDLAL